MEELEQQYQVTAMPVNCEQLEKKTYIRLCSLFFIKPGIRTADFFVPKWVEMLPADHKIRKDLLDHVKVIMENLSEEIRNLAKGVQKPESDYIEEMKIDEIEMDTGCVKIRIQIASNYYYEMLSDLTGAEITGEYELIHTMKHLAMLQTEYESVKEAMDAVQMKGYGVVSPQKEEITLETPVLIRQGNKYGVKIHAHAPSIHMIRANIDSEIAPIVGNEQQAQDLINFIKKEAETEEGIWKTNIFGKSVEELVQDGMRNKIAMINEESQIKLQDTMQKIVNDSNGGLVCIII